MADRGRAADGRPACSIRARPTRMSRADPDVEAEPRADVATKRAQTVDRAWTRRPAARFDASASIGRCGTLTAGTDRVAAVVLAAGAGLALRRRQAPGAARGPAGPPARPGPTCRGRAGGRRGRAGRRRGRVERRSTGARSGASGTPTRRAACRARSSIGIEALGAERRWPPHRARRPAAPPARARSGRCSTPTSTRRDRSSCRVYGGDAGRNPVLLGRAAFGAGRRRDRRPRPGPAHRGAPGARPRGRHRVEGGNPDVDTRADLVGLLETAWAARVRANAEQVDRFREVPDGADFYAPVTGLFRADPRRTDEPVLDALLRSIEPGETWLDIGAGAGRYALPIALGLAPSGGRVIARRPVARDARCVARDRRRSMASPTSRSSRVAGPRTGRRRPLSGRRRPHRPRRLRHRGDRAVRSRRWNRPRGGCASRS